MNNLQSSKKQNNLLYLVALTLIFAIAAFFRFFGINWDGEQHLHPDERFLTSVEASIESPQSLSEYWDTENSSLNPANRNFGYFVYGTFPIFLTRVVGEELTNFEITLFEKYPEVATNLVGELIDHTSYNQIHLIGRALSAIADLIIIYLIFLVAARLYSPKIAILASAFYAFSVLPIQLSHFATVDTFTNLFIFWALTIAVFIATDPLPNFDNLSDSDEIQPKSIYKWTQFVGFGFIIGLGLASKISAAPVVLLLPLAVYIRYTKLPNNLQISESLLLKMVGYLILGGITCLLTFRIFQPYAFVGPTFWDIKLNPNWLDTMKQVAATARGDVDWPPHIQWARRGFLFGIKNITLWGIGLPMAIFSWIGFIWMGWETFQNKWKTHAMLFGTVAFYLIWQSSISNPTFRYFLPVYPGLAIFASWAIFKLWQKRSFNTSTFVETLTSVFRSVLKFTAIFSIIGTIIWAISFMQLYRNPVTRVAASEWIFQNVDGPLTLKLEGKNGPLQQPLSIPYGVVVSPESPYYGQFTAKHDGALSEIKINTAYVPNNQKPIELRITELDDPITIVANLKTSIDFENIEDAVPIGYAFQSDPPGVFYPNKSYQISMFIPHGIELPIITNAYLTLILDDGTTIPVIVNFTEQAPQFEGDVSKLVAFFETPQEGIITQASAFLSLKSITTPTQADLTLFFGNSSELNDSSIEITNALNLSVEDSQKETFNWNTPIEIQKGETYYFRLETNTKNARISFEGASMIVESPWDDPVPLRINGYDGYGGIYPNNMNVELYNHDTPEKRDRMISLVDKTDYITISSSRQWASTTRIPERYPLNVAYYQNLLGCSPEQTIEYCFNVAEVGESGPLGFELVHVEVAPIGIGDFKINDQFSEEAFTVYDHPKVFIFEKTSAYNSEFVASLFNEIDLSKVILLSPKQADTYKSLLLDEETLIQQRESNTWSDLFDVDDWVNSSQIITVLVWYFAILILGISLFPIVRLIFPGLKDKGYPLSRGVGLLLLAYLSWIGTSIGILFSATNIFIIYLSLVLTGVFMGYKTRESLKLEIKNNIKYYLRVELIFLTFFLFSLLVRLGNPDLWHPSKGGEKPMDFAYLNAVLKSNTFPPYDPWFAGGYINYYYFGFIYIGSLIKMLGIIPSVAYNLAIPTLYALISTQSFSIVWNIFQAGKKENNAINKQKISPWTIGILGATLVSTIGNLGSVRMILRGYQKIAAGGEYSLDAGMFTKWGWTLSGFLKAFQGNTMPYRLGDWYWFPSRAITDVPGTTQPITEFPWFTAIYADLHAHFIALPITLLAMAWAISILQDKKHLDSVWQWLGNLLIGGIIIGALKPTNTWDIPTYLAIGLVAYLYASLKKYFSIAHHNKKQKKLTAALGIGGTSLLAILSYKILYFPFDKYYSQAYGQIRLWEDYQTGSGDYFIHWGIFLTIIISWFIWETREWLANTPVSAIHKIRKNKSIIYTAIGMAGILYLILFGFGVRIQWVALPLAIWSAVLLFKPNQSEAKKSVLFMIGTGLFLTMMVEVIVLAGDIGRMNTVFKFYLQAWVLLALSSGAVIGWISQDLPRWKPNWQSVWVAGIGALIFGGAMFTILGTGFKINHRWYDEAPHSLDGMDYMPYAEYHDQETVFELSQDYQAIRWVQENIEGTPTIVEAFTGLYKWGSRFSIYTGLPTVVGWDWHQRQQRDAVNPGWVQERVNDVNIFYATTDLKIAKDFIKTYNVEYIIVGQVERGYFPGDGLEKFVSQNGILWNAIYEKDEMVIYQVLNE
jgi:YYY domain-containing protein